MTDTRRNPHQAWTAQRIRLRLFRLLLGMALVLLLIEAARLPLARRRDQLANADQEPTAVALAPEGQRHSNAHKPLKSNSHRTGHPVKPPTRNNHRAGPNPQPNVPAEGGGDAVPDQASLAQLFYLLQSRFAAQANPSRESRDSSDGRQTANDLGGTLGLLAKVSANGWHAVVSGANRRADRESIRPEQDAAQPVAVTTSQADNQQPARPQGGDADAAIEPTPNTGVVLLNPSTNGIEVQYLFNGQSHTLKPGEAHHIGSPTTCRVEFHRGGDYGNAALSLSQGTFQFTVTARGWDLSAAGGPSGDRRP